jgi:hypothetical protein
MRVKNPKKNYSKMRVTNPKIKSKWNGTCKTLNQTQDKGKWDDMAFEKSPDLMYSYVKNCPRLKGIQSD